MKGPTHPPLNIMTPFRFRWGLGTTSPKSAGLATYLRANPRKWCGGTRGRTREEKRHGLLSPKRFVGLAPSIRALDHRAIAHSQAKSRWRGYP